MAFGDVLRNPERGSRTTLLLEVQADLLAALNSRAVVPLEAADASTKPTRLMPVFEVEGRIYVMNTPQIVGLSRRNLGATVTSIADRRGDIIAALAMLFTGI